MNDAASDAQDAADSDGGADANEPDGPTEPLYLGRFVTTSKGHGCGWSGCEMRLRFKGTGVSAVMDTGWANRFRVSIDGRDSPDLVKGKAGEDTYVLAHDLSDDVHELRVVRITEAGFGEWHIREVRVSGTMLAPRPAPSRRIEFIGDSITCAAGNTGASAHCPLDQNSEDVTLGYPALTATRLHALYTDMCYSGRGVYRDAKGFTSHPMTLLWKRTFTQRRDLLWNPAELQADAVVVNLGTNDTALSYEPAKFLGAHAAFYQTLRKAYPKAHIVYLVGSTKVTPNVAQARADLSKWVAGLGANQNVSFFAIPRAEAGEHEGCAFHPGLRTHERMAESLAKHLATTLHWE